MFIRHGASNSNALGLPEVIHRGIIRKPRKSHRLLQADADAGHFFVFAAPYTKGVFSDKKGWLRTDILDRPFWTGSQYCYFQTICPNFFERQLSEMEQ